MATAKMIHEIRSYDDALEVWEKNGKAHTIKLGHNTWLVAGAENAFDVTPEEERQSGPACRSFSIKYHKTHIVRYYSDGRIRLDTDGHKTVSTKGRLNVFLPLRWGVHQESYQWFLGFVPAGKEPDSISVDFVDGIEINVGTEPRSSLVGIRVPGRESFDWYSFDSLGGDQSEAPYWIPRTGVSIFEAQRHREFHCGDCEVVFGKRGGVNFVTRTVRVTGRVKTWKTRPGDFRIPIKYGLYESLYIEATDGEIVDQRFHTPDQCKPQVTCKKCKGKRDDCGVCKSDYAKTLLAS